LKLIQIDNKQKLNEIIDTFCGNRSAVERLAKQFAD